MNKLSVKVVFVDNWEEYILKYEIDLFINLWKKPMKDVDFKI